MGLAVGWLVIWARRHAADDPDVQNTISSPAVRPTCWRRAVALGVGAVPPPREFAFSGVLAVVTTGLYLGRRGPEVISSESRLQGYAFWELVTFL